MDSFLINFFDDIHIDIFIDMLIDIFSAIFIDNFIHILIDIFIEIYIEIFIQIITDFLIYIYIDIFIKRKVKRLSFNIENNNIRSGQVNNRLNHVPTRGLSHSVKSSIVLSKLSYSFWFSIWSMIYLFSSKNNSLTSSNKFHGITLNNIVRSFDSKNRNLNVVHS